MATGDRFRVTDRDRAYFARQARSLADAENNDEGTPEWREAMRRAENERRATQGLPPLREWWEEKTEMELYRRARALGILGRRR